MERCFFGFVILWLGIAVTAGCGKRTCTPGDTQQCYCPDGRVNQQTCREDGEAWENCDCTYYTAWCDEASGLCWQDPQKDGYDPAEGGVVPADAVRYCNQLAFGGYADWRLPTISELRTLIRGNPDTEPDGECPLHDDSVSSDMLNPACLNAAEYGGPGAGSAAGCYWPPELTGTCSNPDPGDTGHALEYASSTRCPDEPTKGWYGTVMFDNGGVCWNHIETFADVRCVRNAPTTIGTCREQGRCMPGQTRRCISENFRLGAQACADAGDCWGPCESTGFIKSPHSADVCETCDRLKLTIRVPEKLTRTYGQLMGFFYSAKNWSFPPSRPPDGGNSDDQVTSFIIDVDTPYVLTVPGCTYYRTKCLTGEYMIYAALMQSAAIPPVLQAGDYWWGAPEEQPDPITLGSGDVETIEREITLIPWAAQ